MDIDLSKYGYSLEDALKPETLVGLRTLYVDGIDKLNAVVEKKSAKVSKVQEDVGIDAETVALAADTLDAMLDIFDAAVSQNGNVAILLSARLSELKEAIAGECEYFTDELIRAGSPEVGNVTELRQELRGLRDTIGNLYKFIPSMASLGAVLPHQDVFPLRSKNVRGGGKAIVPDIPNFKTPAESGGSAKGSLTALKVTTPAGEVKHFGQTHIATVIHNELPDRITWKFVNNFLKEHKLPVAPTGEENCWNVPLPSGFILSGWKFEEADDE